jgi:1-acyl-sn-glycerol-3-phosphate acyltransferase
MTPPTQDPIADLLEAGRELLSPLEKAQIRFIRRTLQPGKLDRALRAGQRHIGQAWINAALSHSREVHGVDRLPTFEANKSFVLVANHRSFFDLYAVTSFLIRRGLRHRILFPVRSSFFYDNPLGPVVNGAMSFFAMYPPLFREKHRAVLNLSSIDEVARLLQVGGTFVGLHPEGKRGTGDDPYKLLPGQAGVGRVIFASRVPVIPVFINGLGNDIVKQMMGNALRTGETTHVVFGKPIDYSDLLDKPGNPRLYREASERAMAAIGVLGEEEREIRARGTRGVVG